MSSLESIVNRQIRKWNLESKLRSQARGTPPVPRPVITVSRTFGSGGGGVAHLVAQRMHLQVFEREILEQIAEHSDVRRELVSALDENARSQFESWVDGMLRRRMFDEGDYYHHLVQVLLPLAELGSAVIVGRGANYVLPSRPALHVRIVAPLEFRIRRLTEKRGLSREEAGRAIEKSDSERGRFIRRLFDKDWDDPLDYHLVLNTGFVCLEAAAAVIESAWMQRTLLCGKPAEDGEG